MVDLKVACSHIRHFNELLALFSTQIAPTPFDAVVFRSMDGQALPIKSTRDLSPLCEAFTEEDDEDGNPIFVHSSFGFVTNEYIAYFGQSNLRKYELTARVIKDSLRLLPDEDVYPKVPSNITVFSPPIDSNVFFLKRPKLNTAFIGTGLLPKLLLQEAEIMSF
jgi:hypothetical protein